MEKGFITARHRARKERVASVSPLRTEGRTTECHYEGTNEANERTSEGMKWRRASARRDIEPVKSGPEAVPRYERSNARTNERTNERNE